MASFIKNSALYLTATVFLKATSFLLLPLYSNLISPDAYGKVYVMSSLITFLTLFLTFSMNGAIQRFYFDCKSEEEVKRMFSTIFYNVLIISTSFLTGLLILSSSIAALLDVPRIYVLISVITVYFSIFYNLIIALLYARQEAVKISIVSIIIGTVQILAQLVLVLNMEDKALAVILSLGLSGVLNLIIFIAFSRKYLVFVYDKESIKKYSIYGLSQFPSDISTWVVSFFDRVILNKYHNSSAVGIYGMGYTLASVPNVLFQSMNKALSPIVFDNYKKSESEGSDILQYSASLVEKVFVFITFIVCIIVAFSNNIVRVLSSQYYQSGTVMFFVLIAVLIDIYRILFMYPLAYNVKYVKVKSLIWVFASIVSVGLNLLLIPRYSYLGACATLIIVNSITFFAIAFFSKKAIAIPFKKRRMIIVFIISILYACSFFIGSSWGCFGVKCVLLLLYLILIHKIYPIDIISMLRFLKIHK